MKKYIFAFILIFSFAFAAFAERGDDVLSLDLNLPSAWEFPNDAFYNGIGIGVNKIVLPGGTSLMGIDYGVNISVPFQLLSEYIMPINSQFMFGILFVPFNFEKWYFGLGGALGLSMSFSLKKESEEVLLPNFSFDFGAGGEMRGGIMISDKYAITFGCTFLYDFYKLDALNRRYIRENIFTIEPAIGFGIKN